MQDHISTYLGPFIIEDKKSFLIDRDIKALSFAQFGLKGQGVLTTSGGQASAYITSSYAKSRGEVTWPDIQITLAGLAVHETFASDVARAFNINKDAATAYYNESVGKDSFLLIPSVGRPWARGEILLKDSDPKSAPLVDPRYLEHDEDFLVLLEG